MQTIEQIEQELDTKIYPGTEIMIDVGSHHFVKGASGSHSVLVPQPSDDEHDPLVRPALRELHTPPKNLTDIKQNWSPFWKTAAMFGSSLASFVQGIAPLSLAPMFGDYIEAFDSDLASVVQFTGVAILVLGFSNFIW